MRKQNWTREEALSCFNLYCRIPFGKLHSRNPEIIAFADAVGRTPSAVAMKLVNFASLDPAQKKRNIKGLGNVSSLDRAIWEELGLRQTVWPSKARKSSTACWPR